MKKKLHPMSEQQYHYILQQNLHKQMDAIETELEGFLLYCPYCGPVYLSKDRIIKHKVEETPLYYQMPMLPYSEKMAGKVTIEKYKGAKEEIVFRCECHLLLSIKCILSGNGQGTYHNQGSGGNGWLG